MKILVACEESQAITIELRRLGHEAYSCDLQECSGGHPEWHILGNAEDIIPLNDGNPVVLIEFRTMDGAWHEIWDGWDMIIAHPPCTYLTAAGASRLYRNGRVDERRLEKGFVAAEFFLHIWNADCPRIVIENPVPMKVFGLPPYTQIIEPFMFGDPWRKRTCLWVKGCDPLKPTEIVEPLGLWVGCTSARKTTQYILKGHRNSKTRSKTFHGIAKAIAEQMTTGGYVTA